MGYAFSHAINVQHSINSKELMVPYVVYWQGEQATPVPYPALTQKEALENAHAARAQKENEITGWSSGREGFITQSDGSSVDTILIDGWISNLSPPLEMFVYLKKEPFRLIKGFMWKTHPQARKDSHAFMTEFKRGILNQPFGLQCLEYVEQSESIKFSGT